MHRVAVFAALIATPVVAAEICVYINGSLTVETL